MDNDAATIAIASSNTTISADDATKIISSTSAQITTISTISASTRNISKPLTADGAGVFGGITVNNDMLMRMTYVLLGLTFILVLYFGIKFWRIRRRKANVRRYDVLSTQRMADNIGMDSESEDELFDDAQAKLVRNSGGAAGR